jgi:UDP-N-acetylglucosamine diphosphorylase / glucose-1-phosphate thymidylyltransferase / UDP-N-acetylgalactosamine diphosphorylase / glucosamine-1-phosphate N-acetyltransferase / galactosamine-1-phosphate N-acetyltransferase
MLTPRDFFDLNEDELQGLFAADEPVWTALDRLKDYLSDRFWVAPPLSKWKGQVDRPLVIYDGEVRTDVTIANSESDGSLRVSMNGEVLEGAAVILPGAFLANDRIIIGPGTIVEPGAFVRGPVVIGKNAEIRQGAYIRGDCLVGGGCVVGHTTELKGAILLDGAKAGHFAYIGDSILGKQVNLGAGTKLANLKMVPGSVTVTVDKKRYDTGRRKLGAILGDYTETGCNSVTSPGTCMGPHSLVYPCVAVPGGYYPARTIMKPSQAPHSVGSVKR